MNVKRRDFPVTFKRGAVDRVASSGLLAGAAARELGLHETVLRRWMMQYGTQATGPASPHTQAPAPSPSDLAPQNTRLRRENDHLRMGRDILKSRAHVGFADATTATRKQTFPRSPKTPFRGHSRLDSWRLPQGSLY